MTPRTSYKDYVIPWPKDYPADKRKARMQRPEYQIWAQTQNSTNIGEVYSWSNNLYGFTQALD